MISVIQALYVHDRIIERTGGRHGIRDVGLLESALARPFATFDGKDLYGDVFGRAGALMFGIVRNHPFIDGNKRTGITLSAIYLEAEGWHLIATDELVVQFTIGVAEGKNDQSRIAEWFRQHSRRG